MNSGTFELIIPANQTIAAEVAYQLIENHALKAELESRSKNRFVVVAMEMFQNLIRHRSPKHVAVLRTRFLEDGYLKVMTFNMALKPVSEKLSKKFHMLENTPDKRKHFLEVLNLKGVDSEAQPGNLGLDTCFRITEKSHLSVFPYNEEHDLIYLSFSIKIHG